MEIPRWTRQSQKENLPLNEQVRRIKAYYQERANRGPLDIWGLYGSDISSYDREFQAVMDGVSLVTVIRAKSNPVVIDMMAPSSTIASLFERAHRQPHILGVPFLPQANSHDDNQITMSFGLAVSLEDRRDPKQHSRDEKLHIQQVAGNILEVSTWEEISRAFQGRKADLIMERASRGLLYLPMSRRFYAIILSKLWSMVSDQDGMLLLQVPPKVYLDAHDLQIEDWAEYWRRNGIDTRYEPEEIAGAYLPYGSLKIIRTPTSPSKLPVLEAA